MFILLSGLVKLEFSLGRLPDMTDFFLVLMDLASSATFRPNLELTGGLSMPNYIDWVRFRAFCGFCIC
jgi:hypothetical protein